MQGILSAASSPKCAVAAPKATSSSSTIIIFFADLAIKLEADQASDAGVCPMQESSDFGRSSRNSRTVAGNYFGISVSTSRIEELARDTEAVLQRARNSIHPEFNAIGSLRDRSQLFFSLIRLPGPVLLRQPQGISGRKWRRVRCLRVKH